MSDDRQLVALMMMLLLMASGHSRPKTNSPMLTEMSESAYSGQNLINVHPIKHTMGVLKPICLRKAGGAYFTINSRYIEYMNFEFWGNSKNVFQQELFNLKDLKNHYNAIVFTKTCMQIYKLIYFK